MLLQITDNLIINEDLLHKVERKGNDVMLSYIDIDGTVQTHIVQAFEGIELWQMLCKVAAQNVEGDTDLDIGLDLE